MNPSKQVSSTVDNQLVSKEVILRQESIKQEAQGIVEKINEMEIENDEHLLVIETLQGLSSDRKCYRLVNGILVERSVGEVLPSLQRNQQNIVKVIENLNGMLHKKEQELTATTSSA